MQKRYFLYFLLITATAVGSLILAMAVCDDDSNNPDMPSLANGLSRYDGLFAQILFQKGVFHECCQDVIPAQPIISYLARHEKSPPGLPVVLQAA